MNPGAILSSGVAALRKAGRLGDYRIDAGYAAFLLLVVLGQCLVYLTYPNTPFANATGSWEGWADQGQFLRSTRAFAAGDMAPESHWYGLGYPLLGAPFVKLFPKDPFFFVNLAFVSLYASAFLAFFRPVIGYGLTIAAFFVAMIFPRAVHVPFAIDNPIWLQFVTPWNTVPVAAMFMVILLLMRDLSAGGGLWRHVALGACAAVILAIRPYDVLPLVPVGAYYLWRTVTAANPVPRIGAAVAGALVIALPVVALMLHIHGGLSSPYIKLSQNVGFSLSDIGERAFAIFIDSEATHGEKAMTLFSAQPWLIAAIPLSVVWAVANRARGALAIGVTLISLVSYLAYNDLWPFNLFRFMLVHYVVWTLPVLAAAGVAGVMVIIRQRRFVSAACVVVACVAVSLCKVTPTPLAVAAVRIQPAAGVGTRYEIDLAKKTEIDAVDFLGADADWIGVTHHEFTVIADGRPLPLFGGYRMVRLERGVRLIFSRHVNARQIAVVLDSTVRSPPQAPAGVTPLQFRSGFGAR